MRRLIGALVVCVSGLALLAGVVRVDAAGGRDEPRVLAVAGADRPRALPDGLPRAIAPAASHKLDRIGRGGPASGGPEAVTYFMHKRLPEGAAYPINRVNRLADKAEAQAIMLRESASLRGTAKGADFIDRWRSVGPGNVGGRTRALVILDAGAAGPGDETMLAAGVAGGIFKTTDGGATWRPVADLLENIAVSALAVDPADPDTIYAGTGEGYFNVDAVKGMGVFKSTDGGETWRQLEETRFPWVAEFAFDYVNKIAVSPDDPKRVYVATRTGVWRHLNAGELQDGKGNTFFWELVLGNPLFLNGINNANGSLLGATDVAVRPAPRAGDPDPAADEIVLAAFGSIQDDGLFITANGGDTWFRVFDESGASDDDVHRIDTPAQGRMTIAFGPRADSSDQGVVYVCMSRNGDTSGVPDAALDIPFGAVINVFRADMSDLAIDRDPDDDTIITDIRLPFGPRLDLSTGGPELNALLLSNPLFSGVCSGVISPTLNQGWYDNIIAVDPSDENTVWVGGVDLFRSDDGGASFGAASYWYLNDSDLAPEDEGFRDRYMHADQHAIVFCPDYDGAANATLYVANDGGIYRTDNANAPVVQTGCIEFEDVDPDPDVEDNRIVPESISGISWEDLNNGYAVTQFYHGDTAAGTRDILVGGTQDNGVIRTFHRECTESWHEILSGDGGYVAIDPDDNNTIYMENQDFGSVYRIRYDESTGIESVDNINSTLGPDTGLFITPMAMDPSDPDVLWTGGYKPWRTTNAGAADPADVLWEAVGDDFNFPGIPPEFDIIARVSAIAVAPSDPDIVYIGFEDGWVARTTNARDAAGSVEWTLFSTGLPVESGYISSIAVDPDDPDVIWVTNSRFTSTGSFGHVFRGTFDPNEPTGETPGVDLSFAFKVMDGTDCDPDDGFDPVLPDVPANWITLRRCGSGDCSGGDCLIFVGTDIGVFVSDDAWTIDADCDPDGDGGQDPSDKVTWYYINIPATGGPDDNLPRTVVETIDLRDPDTIVAFTHGRGAFVADLTRLCGTAVADPCNPADIAAPFGVLDATDLTTFIALYGFVFDSNADVGQERYLIDMPSFDPPEACGDGVIDLQDLSDFLQWHADGCP